MRPFANSFRHINQALSFAAMRLQARTETRLLAQEIENARENLCVIEETFAEIQRDHEQAIEAILRAEAQLQENILALEEELRQSSSATAKYLLQNPPRNLLRAPRGKDRLERARLLLGVLEGAPYSSGLTRYASKLRQCIFGVEDSVRRHEAVQLARANALRERANGLHRAKLLFQRLVLQTRLLFPENPTWLSQERSLPRAA